MEERRAAIAKIRDLVHLIAADITAIHPLIPALADAPTQTELLKAMYELTKNVEVVKKQLLRLEKGDDTVAL